jgi:aldehyde:ferredoxin oxidoreductase
MFGWTGKLLRVNLTTGTHQIDDLRSDWAKAFVGGRGLAAKYLYEEMDPTVDALSPDNKMIFATGPLTGTNVACGARYMVVTKGALTDAITTSNSGGHWGPELKFAGYDMLILEGQAPERSYLFIQDDRIRICNAEAYWGKPVSDTQDRLREDLGIPDAKVLCIGPAGENLVRFACIMNDKHRAAGRGGVGAVMGSKNLKAIVVRGSRGVRLADPVQYHRDSWQLRAKLLSSPGTGGLGRFGTAATIDLVNACGALPTRNFQEGQFEGSEALNGNTIRETRLVRTKACFACPIACGRVTKVGVDSKQVEVNYHPRNRKTAGEGPEYETAWALGADCGVEDLDAVIEASWLCNDLGMDPISMGSTLASAIEMYQTSTVTDAQTGRPMRFGDGELLIHMTEATAFRRGFGDALAEGAKRMTEKYSRPELFMGVKGQEFPAYDPRGFQGMGVAYATCNRGACHLRAWTPAIEALGRGPDKADPHTPKGKGEWVAGEQNRTTAHDATGTCLFVGSGGTLDDIRRCLVAATGVDYSMNDLIQVGERIWNIERLWNNRAGMTRADDSLPERIKTSAHTSGPSAGANVYLDEMLDPYYETRGWDHEGRPSEAKLAELGLG